LINGLGPPQPTRYPFGWPLLLAPAAALFDGDFQALKAVALACTVANVVLLAYAGRELGLPGPGWALAAAALYGLSPITAAQAGMVMSEPAFLLGTLLALALAGRLGSHAPRRPAKHTHAIVLGVAWVMAASVRTVGLGVVLVTCVWLAARRQWRPLAVAAVAAALLLAAIVAVTPLRPADLMRFSMYGEQLSQGPGAGLSTAAATWPERVRLGLAAYLGQHLRDSVLPFAGSPTLHGWLARLGLGWLPALAAGMVAGTVAIGFWQSRKLAGWSPIHLFAPGYLAGVVVWPWHSERFLYPLLPWLFLFLLLGSAAGVRWLMNRVRGGSRAPDAGGRPAGRWVVAGILGGLLAVQVAGVLRGANSLDHVRDFRAGASWLRANAPAEAVVAAQQPQAIYLYAGRPTIDLPPALDDLSTLACARPVYALLAPRLEWRSDGRLVDDALTTSARQALEAGALGAEAVYTDAAQRVEVFRLGCHAGG
jgi:hypothetical protein